MSGLQSLNRRIVLPFPVPLVGMCSSGIPAHSRYPCSDQALDLHGWLVSKSACTDVEASGFNLSRCLNRNNSKSMIGKESRNCEGYASRVGLPFLLLFRIMLGASITQRISRLPDCDQKDLADVPVLKESGSNITKPRFQGKDNPELFSETRFKGKFSFYPSGHDMTLVSRLW